MPRTASEWRPTSIASADGKPIRAKMHASPSQLSLLRNFLATCAPLRDLCVTLFFRFLASVHRDPACTTT
jgi:hypothetical protein